MRTFLQTWLPRISLCLFLPAAALVSWGELSTSPVAVEAYVWDKALHFIAYFGLSGILCLALKGDRRVLTSTLLIAFLGGVLEILQGIVGRDCSIADEIANILGAFLGAGTGWLIFRLIGGKTLAGRVPT